MRYEDRIDRRGEGGRRPAIREDRWGVFLLSVLLAVLAGPAFALDFSANWDYRQSGGEGVPTQNEFRQRYNLGAGSAVSVTPSRAITASAGVGYTRSHGNDSRGSTARDDLTPYAMVSLMNDIFIAQISGTTDVSTPDDNRSSTASAWDSSLASSWDMPFWPKVRLSYGEQTVESDDREEFSGQTVTNRGASLGWDLQLAQINYQYNATETGVEGSDMKMESDSHFVGFETGGNLWQNRLRFRFTNHYTQSSQNMYSGSSDLLFPLAGEILAGISDPAVLLDPPPSWTNQDTNLSSLPELDDGNEDTFGEGLIVDTGERVHLVFRGNDIGRQVDVLRLTFDLLIVPSEEQMSELQWGLYLNGASGWELVQKDLPFSYAEADRSIEIAVGRFEQEIMVAAVNRTGIPLTISEFRAFTMVTAEGSTSQSTSVNTLTNFSLGYRLTRHLTASGAFIFNHSEFNDGAQENERRTVSGSLRYTGFPLFIPSLAYSESQNEQTGKESAVNRSYSFVVASSPLPTTNLSFGYTLGEQYLGSRKTTSSNRYTVSSRAAIYPDLSAAATISYGENSSWREEGGRGEFDSLTGRLNLHARLRPNLNADLTTSYYLNRPASDRSFQGGEIRAGLRYRPSEILSLRFAYTTNYGDNEKSHNYNLGANLTILNTQKTRLSLNASHYQDEDSRQALSLLGNWKISRSLSLWSRANYLMADQNIYSLQVNLSLAL